MRAAAITAPGTIEILDRPRPAAVGDLVVVKVLIAPMCTEFKNRKGGQVSDVIGHEATGIVVDAGSSRLVSNGDRVVVMPHYGCGKCEYCTSGDHMHCMDQRDVLAETGQECGTATYAQFLLKPDWLLAKIPDDISLEHAAMATCGFGPTFAALQRMNVGALDTLVVSGLGPVGQGAVIQGALRGARVFGIETHPYRTELAYKLGAERVFNPTTSDVVEEIRALTGGRGADAAIETSGAPGAPRAAALATRRRGQMCSLTWNDIELPNLVPLGLTIHGIWHWNHLTESSRMWESIRRAGSRIDTLVTHSMPLDDVSAAMDIQDTGACGKVYLLPHGGSVSE